MNFNPIHATDFYKVGHYLQYPKGTEFVYSNFTPRSDKHAKTLPDFDHKVVFFGLQAICQWLLIDAWDEGFFKRPKEEVITEYKRRMDRALGAGVVDTKHIEELHDLGYLPILIKALPEGSRVNIRVPFWTIQNTDPRFYWVTNYLETQLSAESIKFTTSATTAYEYRRLFDKYAEETGVDAAFVPWQGHDFSFRGMSGISDAMQSGAAHLLSFSGTDTIPAIDFVEKYYTNGDPVVAGSVPATEHSVMTMGGTEGEFDIFKRLITETYPTGIISIVADSFDYWQVMTEFIVKLKEEILARNGKVVFRPDSGNPVDIICGIEIEDMNKRADLDEAKSWMEDFLVEKVWEDTPFAERGDDEVEGFFRYGGKTYRMVVSIDWNRYDKQYYYVDGHDIESCDEVTLTPEQKGSIECLWDVFGGTITSKGYKQLDSHVGLIYGDSITLDIAQEILRRLKEKGFSSGNVVLGIGSYTYQYVTRDTFGLAVKATYGVVNGVPREIFKDPKTDSGMKKSARGLLRVEMEDGNFVLYDRQTPEQEKRGLLQPVFYNGKLVRYELFSDIQNRLFSK